MGLYNVCSGIYKRLGGHFIACVWIDSSVGPLSWSFLGYVGLLLVYACQVTQLTMNMF
jgi:hypothetical protein